MSDSVEDAFDFSVHLAKDVFLAMSLQENLQEFLQGIHSLLNHKISPYIVPFSDISATISNIKKELRATKSKLKLKSLTTN